SSFTAWTTRVSNPVCYPRFRTSASVTDQRVAFATGVPPHLYAFHRYTWNSTLLFCTQVPQFPMTAHGYAVRFHIRLKGPPARALRPIIPDNACPLRITAAAGTYLAGAFWLGTVKASPYSNDTCSSPTTEFYDPKTFVTHAALHRQTFVHCG